MVTFRFIGNPGLRAPRDEPTMRKPIRPLIDAEAALPARTRITEILNGAPTYHVLT